MFDLFNPLTNTLGNEIVVVFEMMGEDSSGYAKTDGLGIDLSTARPKWRLDGPALSVHLLYSLVNHAYTNRYHHHPVL